MMAIYVIEHALQRYPTLGDWYWKLHDLVVTVSDTGNEYYNFLIGMHEAIEAYLCKAHGITSQIVDEWDKTHLDHPEPGSIPGCPYYREHMLATMIERTLAADLDVDWDEYEERLEEIQK